MVMSDALRQLLDFDVDRYVNPYVPHNRLHIFPQFISRWLGYRTTPQKEPWQVVQWPITFLATVGGLCLVGGIHNYSPGIHDWNPPVLIASLGASAVLDFNTIKSPLAQPRNSVLGNTLSALSGVAIAKLFQHSSSFKSIEWVSGAVGCALASWLMSITNTIHPPGGATAVLAPIQPQVIAMGWRYVPLILLDSVLMVIVALIFNNIARQYPLYWWSSGSVGSKLTAERRKQDGDDAEAKDAEKGGKQSDASSDITLKREQSNHIDLVSDSGEIQITPHRIRMPPHIKLDGNEIVLLHSIQERIRMHDGSKSS